MVGKESTYLKTINDDFGVSPTESYKFYNGKHVVHKFEGNVSPAGRKEYEFEI